MLKSFLRPMPAALLLAASLLTGCASTTQGGAIGANRSQLLLVSEAEMAQSAQQYYAQQNAQARAKGQLITSGAEYERVHTIMRRIVPQVAHFRADALNWKWQLVLINQPEINAHVMPGGKVTFYTGIIRQLKLSNDEVAAIMGHEMAHALREHSREKASVQQASGLAISLGAKMLGVNQGQMDLIGMGKKLALDLPFSRSMESEADALGLELAARAGYDPRAALTLWDKMAAASGDGGLTWLSTHPAPASRKADMAALMPKVMPLYEATRGKKR